MNLEQSRRFVKLMQNQLEHYNQFLDLEKAKTDYITNNNILKLNSVVKHEEVFLLKSKGLEAEAAKIQAECQIPEYKMSQVVEALDSECRQQGREVFHELSTVVIDLRDVNKANNRMAKMRLEKIGNEIEKLDKSVVKNNAYSSSGEKMRSQSKFISKKV